MSTLANESLYETCFDESFDEYMRLSGLSSADLDKWIKVNPYVLDWIENMAWKKFQSMCQWAKWTPNPPQWGFFAIIKESNEFLIMFVDPRFEDDAIAALMEEALSTDEETKFDVEAYIENSNFEW